MSIYNRKQTSVEAFQVPFPIDIVRSELGVVRANTNDWVIRDERNRIVVMSNEDFSTQFEKPPSKVVFMNRAPGVSSKVITPEDVDMSREF